MNCHYKDIECPYTWDKTDTTFDSTKMFCEVCEHYKPTKKSKVMAILINAGKMLLFAIMAIITLIPFILIAIFDRD